MKQRSSYHWYLLSSLGQASIQSLVYNQINTNVIQGGTIEAPKVEGLPFLVHELLEENLSFFFDSSACHVRFVGPVVFFKHHEYI